MAKREKLNKNNFKIKVKKITPEEIQFKKKETSIEITEKENDVNNQKFMEFLTPSIESIKTLGGEKPRIAKRIEQNEEVLSFIPKEEDRNKKKEVEYSFSSRGPDYNLAKTNEKSVGIPLIKASTLEKFDVRGRPMDSQRREWLNPNPELANTDNKTEKNYIIGGELPENEIKYKSKRFR